MEDRILPTDSNRQRLKGLHCLGPGSCASDGPFPHTNDLAVSQRIASVSDLILYERSIVFLIYFSAPAAGVGGMMITRSCETPGRNAQWKYSPDGIPALRLYITLCHGPALGMPPEAPTHPFPLHCTLKASIYAFAGSGPDTAAKDVIISLFSPCFSS